MKSNKKKPLTPTIRPDLSLMGSTLNRSTSAVKLRLRPSTTTNHHYECSTLLTPPYGSTIHSQRPSATIKSELLPLQAED